MWSSTDRNQFWSSDVRGRQVDQPYVLGEIADLAGVAGGVAESVALDDGCCDSGRDMSATCPARGQTLDGRRHSGGSVAKRQPSDPGARPTPRSRGRFIGRDDSECSTPRWRALLSCRSPGSTAAGPKGSVNRGVDKSAGPAPTPRRGPPVRRLAIQAPHGRAGADSHPHTLQDLQRHKPPAGQDREM